MLKRLRVDNFKSLINLDFEPGPVNLLIGRNNSGKTNLCQAIRFLALTCMAPLAESASIATGDPWNLTNVYLQKDTVTFECRCEIQQAGESLSYEYTLEFKVVLAPHLGPISREFHVENEYLKVTGGKFPPGTVLLQNNSGQVKLLHEGRLAQKIKDHFVETTAPTTATMLSRLYDLQHNRSANIFKESVGNWLYYDLETIRLRSGEAKFQGLILAPDGSNLSNVLYLLKTIDDRRYRRLIDIVREVEPKLDSLNFFPPAQESVFMVLTDARDKRFGMASISSGTLRFMALAYVITMTAALAENRDAPLVIIEEPENGVYVGHFKKLMEMIEPTGRNDPQFIFTSHSPYFIDLFDKYLNNVFGMKSDETHSEIVKPDAKRLEMILEQFSLGEAHYRELLG